MAAATPNCDTSPSGAPGNPVAGGRRGALPRFAALFLPAAAALMALVYLVYRLESAAALSALRANARHAVELQGRVTEARLSSVISDLLVLASHHELRLLMERMSDGHLEALGEEFRIFSATKRSYDQVRYLDASGQEIVRVNRTATGAATVPRDQLQDKSDRYYFVDALPLEPRQIFVSPFDLNVEGGRIEVPHKPMLRFATPVVDARGAKRGIVILNYLGEVLLNDMTGGADAGDMMLLNSDGYWLKSPRSEDEWGFMLEGRQERRLGVDFPAAWPRISAGESGQFRTDNGLFTFTTVHPARHEVARVGGADAGGPWKIVCHTPQPVIEAANHRLARSLLFLAALLLSVAAAGAWVLALNAARRRSYAEALRAARDAAIEASRAKSDFLANTSHEIRTPLNGVVGMTELLLTTELTPVQRNYLEAVDTSAEALMAIINDLLDLSKIEAGKMELESAPFRLGEALDSVLEIMAMRANEKGLELTGQIDGDVPDSLVGDSVRLRQVIINLAGNAVKFTASGEVAIHVAAEHCDANQVQLVVRVRDTGIGIPLDRQKAIFEAFSQADSSTTRRFGGTGLGLTISSQLVDMMNGRIWVESEEGVGSTFAFTARFALAAEPVPARDAELPGDIAGRRVLIVDDNATNRRILEDTLRGWDMAPTAAASGPEALDLAGRAAAGGAPFEMVLLDFQMPDMDGLEVARRFHGNDALNGAVVILLSSVDSSPNAATMEEVGLHSHLRKPVTQSGLRTAILQALPGAGPSRPSALEGHADDGQAPLRILLAEDNKINQAVATGMLEKEGHTVTVAANGRLALEALAEGGYDLVLMDVQMPEMGGLEATAQIRSGEEATGDHIPIVGLTANAMKSDEEACLAAGMDAFLAKPLRRQRLVEVLASVEAPPAPEPGSAAADVDDTPVVDGSMLDELRELEAEGAFSLREVVEIFETEAEPRLAAIGAALAAGNGPDLKREAHTLKGSARDLGALRLVAVCQEMEDRGGADRFDGAEALLEGIAVELAAARAELTALLE